MFRRKSDAPVVEPQPVKAEGKGRPTPSRREQEAANKARAKAPRTRKEQNAAARLSRADSSSRMREAMRTGDERYLPTRDRGPVRRFVRDWIDCRFTVGEIVLPVLIFAMLLGFVGSPRLAFFGTVLTLIVIVLTVVNLALMRFRLRAELKRRFPDASLAGTTYYAVVRAVQVRFLRMPKPQVKIGQELPQHYR